MTIQEYENQISALKATISNMESTVWSRLDEINKLKLELSSIRGKHSYLVSAFDHLNAAVTELTKTLTS